jgi:cell division protein FtsB
MVNWKRINKREFLTMFLVVLLAAFGSNFIFINNLWFKILGSIFLLSSFGTEFYLLTKIDTRSDIKETKNEIEKLVSRAEKINNEIEETAKELREMKKKVFGWHDPIFSFKSIKEDLEEVKKQIGLRHGLWGGSSSNINDRLRNMEKELENLKRKLDGRF